MFDLTTISAADLAELEHGLALLITYATDAEGEAQARQFLSCVEAELSLRQR